MERRDPAYAGAYRCAMSHYGPVYETHDITGERFERVMDWVVQHPEWLSAEIRSCSCEICGDVTELVRRKNAADAGS
jgi:hypothetical protein